MLVMKFGGSSLAGAERIRHVAGTGAVGVADVADADVWPVGRAAQS